MEAEKTKSCSSSSKSQRAAEDAVRCIGLGYDVAADLRLKSCKKRNDGKEDSMLIAADGSEARDVLLPGGVFVKDVSKSIKCDKGDRLRFSSDVLSFQQMSEQLNQELSLSGKIPSGYFNSSFDFSGSWQKDAASTKTLAFDGVFITLYNIALEKSQLVLRDHVKQAVPSCWDPVALARFIEKFGTHVIVGVKMGGKDVIYAKQEHLSTLQPADVQRKLKELADGAFKEATSSQDSGDNNKFGNKDPRLSFTSGIQTRSYFHEEFQDVKFNFKRKGGSYSRNLSHKEWSHTVHLDPDVISMSFVPLTSLLNGLEGSGFLGHAINLYLRYKPPIEELYQFLDFQLPRQWAPVFGELPLGPERKQQKNSSLQFSLLGPKLYVNTIPVDAGRKPVTGLRLYLEGKRSNCLAVHLQHLSSLPKTFQLQDEPDGNFSELSSDRRYYEKVQWKSFSHVCTVPVESNEDLNVVTGAHFEVGESGLKKVLFLRLHFSKVVGPVVARQPEWDNSPGFAQKSGIISTLISTRFSTAQKPPPKPSDININSALYPGRPPTPTQVTKLLKFVDTSEMTRGPQDSPGYWVVSGARLVIDNGKISLRVKYSLLTTILPDEEVPEEY